MPLNLDEFIVPDDEIIYGGKKYVVTAQVPRKLFEKITNLLLESNVDADTTPEDIIKRGNLKKLMNSSKEILREVLYLKNERAAVDAFMNEVIDQYAMQAFAFVANFIANAITGKKKQS